MDPLNDFSVSFDWDEVRKSSEEILNLPERASKEKKIQIVVLDFLHETMMGARNQNVSTR
jgi:hypothetical protein